MEESERKYLQKTFIKNVQLLADSKIHTGEAKNYTGISRSMGLEPHYLNGLFQGKTRDVGLTKIIPILDYFQVSLDKLIDAKTELKSDEDLLAEKYHISIAALRSLLLFDELNRDAVMSLREKGYSYPEFLNKADLILLSSTIPQPYAKRRIENITTNLEEPDEEEKQSLYEYEKIKQLAVLNYLISKWDYIAMLTAIIFAEDTSSSELDQNKNAIDSKEVLLSAFSKKLTEDRSAILDWIDTYFDDYE